MIFSNLKRHQEVVCYHSNGSNTDFAVKGQGRDENHQADPIWDEDASEIAMPERELICFKKLLEGNKADEVGQY